MTLVLAALVGIVSPCTAAINIPADMIVYLQKEIRLSSPGMGITTDLPSSGG